MWAGTRQARVYVSRNSRNDKEVKVGVALYNGDTLIGDLRWAYQANKVACRHDAEAAGAQWARPISPLARPQLDDETTLASGRNLSCAPPVWLRTQDDCHRAG